MRVVGVVAFVTLLVAALVVARRNLRVGRGDRQSAFRLAFVAVVGQMITWALNDPHIGDANQEIGRLFASIGESLFAGGLLYVMYFAVEPAVRRHWPDSLLGWTRLLRGRLVDARVGRDVLVGLAAGAVIQGLSESRALLQHLAGSQAHFVGFGNLRFFEGPSYAIGFIISLLAFQAAFNALWCIFAIVGLKHPLKRMWFVAIVASFVLAFIAPNGYFPPAAVSFLILLALVAAASYSARAQSGPAEEAHGR
jgi:hypothetical protein